MTFQLAAPATVRLRVLRDGKWVATPVHRSARGGAPERRLERSQAGRHARSTAPTRPSSRPRTPSARRPIALPVPEGRATLRRCGCSPGPPRLWVSEAATVTRARQRRRCGGSQLHGAGHLALRGIRTVRSLVVVARDAAGNRAVLRAPLTCRSVAGTARRPGSRLADVQPSLRSRRRIGVALRPEPQLSYDRLSDPILVRRAKDGDARALEALCARHAPRVERLAAHVLGDPEDARDAAQDALAKAVHQDRPVSRRGGVLDLAPPADAQRLPRRRAAPERPAARPARGGIARRAGPRARPGGRAVGAARRAPRRPRRAPGRAGARARAQGRARVLVRGDLGGVGDAGRDRQVLRPPRPRRHARAARERDAPA